MPTRPKNVGSLYNAIFENYQQNRAKADNDIVEKPAILATLGSVKGKRVLDLGCGLGGHTSALLKKGANVVAVDASKSMVEYAKAHNKGAEFLVANFEKLSFPTRSFDALLASYSIHYVKDIHRLFAKFARWLKPGGKFVFSIYHPIQVFRKVENFDYTKVAKYWLPLRSYNAEIFYWHHPIGDYYDALQRAGFEIQSIQEYGIDRKYKGFHLDQYRLPSCLILEAVKRA